MTTTKNREYLLEEVKKIRKELRFQVEKNNIQDIDIKINEINIILNELKQQKYNIQNKNKYVMKNLRVYK